MTNKLLQILIFCLLLVFQAKANIEIFEVKGVPSAKDCTGSISIKIDGNSGPYDISAINGTTNSAVSMVYTNVTNGVHTFSGLCVGDYNIFVVDKNATIGGSATCKKTLMASVIVCQPFDIVEDAKSKIVCGDDKSGFIEVSIKGGVAPYKYLWSSGQTTEDISGLEGDKVYTLMVTDKQGCTASKSITVDGQKVNFDIDMVFAGVPCTGSAKLNSISTTGSLSSNSFQITWLLPQAVNNVKEVKGLCDNTTYNVAVTSEQGCKVEKSFNLPNCSSKPLSIFPVDTKYFSTGSQANIAYHKSFRYCDKDSRIHIQMEGGTPPIKYTFKSPKGKVIQYGIVNPVYPSHYLDYFQGIPLVPYITGVNGTYTFQAIDACGNQQKIDLQCDCQTITNINPFFKYDRCDKESTDIEIGFNKAIDHYYTFTSPTFQSKKYDITWCNAPTSAPTVTKVEIYTTSAEGNLKILQGPTSFKKASGLPDICTLKIEDEQGCKSTYCTSFSVENGGNIYCSPMISSIKTFNPNTNFMGGIGNTTVLTNNFYAEYKDCQDLCYPKYPQSPPIKILTTTVSTANLTTYIPKDYTKPCVSGTLKYPCINNDGKFKVVDIQPFGVWYEDIDLKSIQPVVSPLFASTRCEADCYCYFPFGELLDGVFDNAYPYPKYFKTKKVLDETYKCEPVVPPVIPPNPVVIVGSNPPSSSSSPCNTDLIGEEKGNCKYDFICPATGVVVEKDVYIGNYCILAIFDSKFCNQNIKDKDLCSIKCSIDGFLRYDLVKYCEIDDLCGVGTPYITIKSDITVTGGSIPPQKGDGYKIRYKYKGEDVKACFEDVFSIAGPVVSPKMANNVTVKSGDAVATVFPNPFQNQLTIILESPKSSKTKIVLMNILGGIVQIQDVEANKGTNNFEFNFQDSLPQGMYYLQIIGEDYKLQYPIVHQ